MFTELAVPDVLRPWIAGISVAASAAGTAVDIPDHATTLVLRDGHVVAMGPRTRAGYHVSDAGPTCVRVRMRPGRARALLGRSPRDLADRAVPVPDLPGLDPDRLAADPVGALTSALRDREPPDDLLEHAARLLPGADVAATARRLHVSERHLRNLFTEGVGLAPKHFARIARVRTVLADSHDRRLADLAAAAGYYDQSHMTAEFRHLMGVPPAAFAAGRRPAPRRCG